MKKQTILEVIENGGATLNKRGDVVNFETGYQVSKKDCYTINAGSVDKIARAINYLLRRVSGSEFVGVWINDGMAYIDISERIESKQEALRLGDERGQKSVYDWAKCDCIYC